MGFSLTEEQQAICDEVLQVSTTDGEFAAVDELMNVT